VPTWLETPGECRAPVTGAAPSGAIPSERGLGRDVGHLAALKMMLKGLISPPPYRVLLVSGLVDENGDAHPM
jgi:hypothetical protein